MRCCSLRSCLVQQIWPDPRNAPIVGGAEAAHPGWKHLTKRLVPEVAWGGWWEGLRERAINRKFSARPIFTCFLELLLLTTLPLDEDAILQGGKKLQAMFSDTDDRKADD
eukprot:m.95275 g.95275  ORF g.95275 m.95275 type:complete len:110 (-) comp12324_c0_seq2:148-477(-)